MNKKAACHGCGVGEGQLHDRGCDMERCPFCGGQLISCACSYKHLGYPYDPKVDFCGLPLEVYEHGLGEDDDARWEGILEKKGRIPFIQWPNVCGRCGTLWPEMFMFMVLDAEWKHYIEPAQRHKLLCRKCWDEIVLLINTKGRLLESEG